METKTDINKFKDFLREYLPAMNETIPTLINEGGCGFFAYTLSIVLDEMGVDHKIVILNEYEAYHESILRLIKGEKEEQYGVFHAVVKIGDDFFDATGKPAIDLFGIEYRDVIPEDKLKILVDDKSQQWSDVFDVRQKSKIEAYLKDIPSQFSKWHKGKFHSDLRDEKEKTNINSYTKTRLQKQSLYSFFLG